MCMLLHRGKCHTNVIWYMWTVSRSIIWRFTNWLHHGIEWLALEAPNVKICYKSMSFLISKWTSAGPVPGLVWIIAWLKLRKEDWYYKVFSHQLLLIKNLIIDCEMQSHVRVIRPGRADLEDGMQIYLSNFTLPEFSPQPITIQVFSLCVIKSQQRTFDTADHQQRW